MNASIATTSLNTLALILLGAASASAQIAIGSSLHDDTEVDPGMHYSGTIVIRNLSDELQEAKIYQTDYTFQADGSNRFGEPGSEQRSNAGWITLSASNVTVPASGSVPLEYNVEVPSDVDGEGLEGSYWSMIMIEGIPRESPESILQVEGSEVQLGVRQVVRYGVQIATHVRGTGRAELAPRDPAVSIDDSGAVAFQVALANRGTRLIVPDCWMEVYGDQGEFVGRFNGTQSRIYPSTSVSQKFTLGTLDAGEYKALAVFDGGGAAVDAAEYRISIP